MATDQPLPRSGADAAPRRTYAVHVLGCKVNQCESRQMAEALEALGLEPATADEIPDVGIVHTCAVTAAALQKSAQAVRRMAARAAGRLVLASGCGGAKGLLPDDLPVEAVIPAGPNWMAELRAALARFPTITASTAAPTSRPEGLGSHTRAFLKIQDGCDLGCSYCIVPSLRGGSRDRPMAALLREARALARAGHRELVVTGVSVGLFGRHGGPGLPEALRRLNAVRGLERLRLSSLHPAEVTDELLAVWKASPRMAPHLHLPLQSGSARVLRAMRRGYTPASFLAAVRRARRALGEVAMNTDIIVGFPGETEEDFLETEALCRRVGFSRMHLFPYSPRPGTPAAARGDRVPEPVVKARTQRLQALAHELAEAFHRRFLGREVRVMAETRRSDGKTWEGYSEHYMPVRFEGPAGLRGRMLTIRIDAADVHGARGRLTDLK